MCIRDSASGPYIFFLFTAPTPCRRPPGPPRAAGTCRPVSYTHLDVYKRQRLPRIHRVAVRRVHALKSKAGHALLRPGRRLPARRGLRHAPALPRQKHGPRAGRRVLRQDVYKRQVMVLAPIIFFVINKCGKYVVIVLTFIWLLGLWPRLPIAGCDYRDRYLPRN